MGVSYGFPYEAAHRLPPLRAVVCAWTVDVVVASYARFEAVVALVSPAELLADELLPAVALQGVARDGVLLLQGGDIGLRLKLDWVDTSGATVEEAFHTCLNGPLQHVCVHAEVVAHHICLDEGYVAYASHVCGQVEDVVLVLAEHHAGVRASQIHFVKIGFRRNSLPLAGAEVVGYRHLGSQLYEALG